MQILIIGGAGDVGQYLIKGFTRQVHAVRIIEQLHGQYRDGTWRGGGLKIRTNKMETKMSPPKTIQTKW